MAAVAQNATESKPFTMEDVRPLQDRVSELAVSSGNMFLGNYGHLVPVHEESAALRLATKIAEEYGEVKDMKIGDKKQQQTALQKEIQGQKEKDGPPRKKAKGPRGKARNVEEKEITKVVVSDITGEEPEEATVDGILQKLPEKKGRDKVGGGQLVSYTGRSVLDLAHGPGTALILAQRARKFVKPVWHAPWKLMRVISGHLGWVRSIAVDPANEWFCTGAADRTIKIWDLASGKLKLTLTGHISAVRGLEVSSRHPYLFSVGEDKMVKCWDLEQNKTIRAYHGHLSGVFCCAVHPALDLLMTGGRDSTCRVWDIRTKAAVHVLSGHKHTVADVFTQATDPQVVTSSHDCTIRLWDLAAGKSMTTLTNHKKSVRALCPHPTEYTFASGSADNIKVWKMPEGIFLRNHPGHNAIINTMCMNRDNVLVSGADNGSINFWDWNSGHCFQEMQTVVQPGSLDSEAGIFQARFDLTGSRLITAEADKTIKIWKEDETATPESHPIDWKPNRKRKRY